MVLLLCLPMLKVAYCTSQAAECWYDTIRWHCITVCNKDAQRSASLSASWDLQYALNQHAPGAYAEHRRGAESAEKQLHNQL